MQKPDQTPWHTLGAQATLARLSSARTGLTADEAMVRLKRFGENALEEIEAKRPIGIFFDQFRDFMIGVLIAAAIISGFIGEAKDTIIILVIVLLNAVIGFVQEYRSEQAMESLRNLAAPHAAVRRDGNQIVVETPTLVPGDIVMIEAGDVVPADLRLLETTAVAIDESAMTGESMAVEKTTETIPAPEAALADRVNLAHAGTIVVGGHGVGVVVDTGPRSQLGRIASLVDMDETKTPLQKRLTRFGQTLALIVLAISAVVFLAGVARGEDPSLMLLTAISLAVAAIPETLPAAVTISLALGAQQLAKRAALIRSLPAVETLGSVTYICSDKTGTLTKNKMTATELFASDRFLAVTRDEHALLLTDKLDPGFKPAAGSLSLLFAGLIGCNNAVVKTENGQTQVVAGAPTERALAALALDAGAAPALPRLSEITFNSRRKRMTTTHRIKGEQEQGAGFEGRYVSFTKGAFDVLFPRVDKVWSGSKSVPLAETQRQRITQAADSMAADGLRVIAMTCRYWDTTPPEDADSLENSLILLGLVGIMDPPRNEAVSAVKLSREAGITTVMITGDHPATARRIAQDLGIAGPSARVVTGPELEKMSDQDLEAIVGDLRIYARVAPEHKIKIVRALQNQGELVAMTGDGVNDAPALKAANIGVAMGVTGTDVAKEASDLVLLDDNFATIVNAVAGGRRIYDNIRRFIQYTLTSNSAEILVVVLAPFAGLPLPLLPIHILWINLVTDGLPGLGLATEPPESRVMARRPRDPRENIFSRGLWQHVVRIGILMAGVSLFSQAWFLSHDGAWQTAVFSVLALSQMGHALAVRSETDSLFSQGLFTNPFLLFSVGLTLSLQLLIIYAPPLQNLFRTESLTGPELALVLGLSTIVFFAVEIEKLVKRRSAP